MEREQFEVLVKKLEELAEKQPEAYKARVFGLAVLGYGYLLAVLVGILGLGIVGIWLLTLGHGTGYVVAKKLLIPLVVLAFVVIRAMWVRIAPPEGIPLNRKDFPLLFRVLDNMRARLKGPKIHTVLLTDEFNAAISQVPRLGILGWPKNYLILGLPLMQGLTPHQLKAVLAHEYGHLSGAHGKFSAWIYRIRQTWYQLMEKFDQEERWGQGIFQKFFDWYAPYFGAYSFVLARANEYEADRCSADLTSPRLAADALTAVYLKGESLEKDFWPALYRRAEHISSPIASMYVEMGKHLQGVGPGLQKSELLVQLMEEETGSDDTHPCLRDRLAALGQEAQHPGPVTETAADVLLKEKTDSLVQQLSQEWSDRVQEGWNERHQYVTTSLARLESLKGRCLESDVTVEEAYEYAKLSEEFCPEIDAVDPYRVVVNLQEDHVSAHYALGRLLLDQGHEEGVSHIERAMTLDPQATLDGCREVYHFFKEQDRLEEAESYKQRFELRVDFEERVEAERESLLIGDTYVSHDADSTVVDSLIQQLKNYKQIGRAYLVRKQTTLSNEPLYVLGIQRPWFWLYGENSSKKLTRCLADEITFSGEIFYIVLDWDNREFRKLFSRISGSMIFQRHYGLTASFGSGSKGSAPQHSHA